MNSDESNLFSIRLNLPEISSTDLDSSSLVKDVVYVSPTKNNLPVGFSLKFESGTGLFTITYGKTFTTIPSLNINFYDQKSTHIQIVTSTKTSCTFYLYRGFDSSNDPEKVTGITSSLPLPKSSFLILGSTKLGLTTGNSNKGWQIESGSNPNSVFTFMNVGIGKGLPTSSLEVVDTNTTNNSVNIVSDSLTTGSALNISSASTSTSERDLVKITNSGSTNNNTTLMNIDGSNSKYALKVNGHVNLGTNELNKLEIPHATASQLVSLTNTVELNATCGTIHLYTSNQINANSAIEFTVKNSLCDVNTHIQLSFLHDNSNVLCNVISQASGEFKVKLSNVSSVNHNTSNSRLKFMLFNGNIVYSQPLFDIQRHSTDSSLLIVNYTDITNNVDDNSATYNWQYYRGNQWNDYNPVQTNVNADNSLLRRGPSMTTKRLQLVGSNSMYMIDNNGLPSAWSYTGNLSTNTFSLTAPDNTVLSDNNNTDGIEYPSGSGQRWKMVESIMTVRVHGTYTDNSVQKTYETNSFRVHASTSST